MPFLALPTLGLVSQTTPAIGGASSGESFTDTVCGSAYIDKNWGVRQSVVFLPLQKNYLTVEAKPFMTFMVRLHNSSKEKIKWKKKKFSVEHTKIPLPRGVFYK